MGKEGGPRIYSRREAILKVLGIAGGVVTDLALLNPKGAVDVAQLANQGIEHPAEARRLVATVVEHPLQAKDVFALWNSPKEVYKQSSLLERQIEYSSSDSNIVVIAFGDSNMVGAEGKDQASSPIKLFSDGLRKKLGVRSRDFNLAFNKATTKIVISDQLTSEKAHQAFSQASLCDVWINAGANDLSAVVNSREEILEAENLRSQPLLHPEILFKYGSRMSKKLDEFKDNFGEMLTALNGQYGTQIRNLVIMSVPDFSQAPSITPQSIGDEYFHLPLEDPSIKALVRSISIKMNNSMFEAAEDFQRKNHGIRVIGIDTFPISDFVTDQHLSRQAMIAIADDAMNRVQII